MGIISTLMGTGKGGGGGGASPAGLIAGAIIKRMAKKSDNQSSDTEPVDSYHSGGKVRKTGLANLRKGETVLTKTQLRALKARKKSGRSGRSRKGKSR